MAAKSNDLDEKVPSIKDLLAEVNLSEELGFDFNGEEGYDDEKIKKAYLMFNELYCKIEFLIFEAANFSIIRPTHIDFLLAFQEDLITEEDATKFDIEMRLEEIRSIANDYMKLFLNAILENIQYHTLLPSRVAAGLVAATRKMLLIDPFPPHLQDCFRCTFEDIEEIFNQFEEIANENHDNLWDNDISLESQIDNDSGFCEEDNSLSAGQGF